MRRCLFLILIVVILASSWPVAHAGDCASPNVVLAPFAKESLTISTTAVTLTAATYAPSSQIAAAEAFITVETDKIRWWVDGSAPSSTVGHEAQAGGQIQLCAGAIATFKAIRSGSADATLRVSYLRQ